MAKQARGIGDLNKNDRLCRERGHDWAEPRDYVTSRRAGVIVSFRRVRICRRSDEHVQTTEDIKVRTGESTKGAVTKCGADYGVRGIGRVSRAEVLVANIEDNLTRIVEG